MNVSGSTSLLDSILNAQTTQAEAGVSVLKKAQDVETRTGQAMVDMLDQIGPTATQSSLSAHAQGFSAYA